jgi:hypothetical protein
MQCHFYGNVCAVNRDQAKEFLNAAEMSMQYNYGECLRETSQNDTIGWAKPQKLVPLMFLSRFAALALF